MFKLFCAPGRLVASVFTRNKKKMYRSARSKPSTGPGIAIISLVCWIALIVGALYLVDKSGLLKQALDVGVEVAQSVENEKNAEQEAQVAAGSGSASGGLTADRGERSELTPGSSESSGSIQVESEQWLVILHTIPKSSRDEAERRQAQYRNKGLTVEILDTDAFPRLISGHWIIAQGPFDDRASAFAAADTAKAFNNGLIVRRGL